MKNSFQPRRRGVQRSAFATLALLPLNMAQGGEGTPDPLLTAGEQAIVGSYKLDNVLLAPRKLVVLPNGSQLFEGAGDMPAQAAQKGLLNAEQLALLQKDDCTMTIRPDRTFAITNLPTANLSQSVGLMGTWSLQVYHVWDTYGYRINLNCSGTTAPALRAKFLNADKPDPRMLQIFYGDGQGAMFRLIRISKHL